MRIVGIIFAAVLVIVAGTGIYFYQQGGAIIRSSVERDGSEILKAAVKLKGTGLNILAGSASLSGFSISNPQGFSDEKAFSVDRIAIDLEPMSVFSDTIDIEDITIAAPQIFIEPSRKGLTNLQQLQKNLEAFTGPSSESSASDSSTSPNVIIRKLTLADPVVGFVGSDIGLADQKLEIGTITLENIGVKEGGVPTSDLVRIISDAVMPKINQALASGKGKELLNQALSKIGSDLQIDGDVKEQVKDKVKDEAEKRLKGLLNRGG